MLFFGIAGFVIGFLVGLFIVSLLTQHIPRDQLLRDKQNRWQYGLIIWICGGLGVIAALLLFPYTF